MAIFTQFIQSLINGFITGSVIALGAVGLTLSYAVTRFINFAYGEFLTFGAFFAWAAVVAGLALPISAVIGVIGVGLLGILVSLLFYRPIRSRGPIPLLITSIGVALILRSSLRGIVGTRGKQYPIPLIQPFRFDGLFIGKIDTLMVLISFSTIAVIFAILKFTTLGKTMRATSGNRMLTRVSGIDVDQVIRRTWFISAAVGGLAGILLAIRFQPFRPIMGWRFLLVVFAATLVGGIGRPIGAMFGALIIGVTMSVGTTFFASEYTLGYAFIMLVIVLLARPEGILGGEEV